MTRFDVEKSMLEQRNFYCMLNDFKPKTEPFYLKLFLKYQNCLSRSVRKVLFWIFSIMFVCIEKTKFGKQKKNNFVENI